MKRYIKATTSKNVAKFNIVVELEYTPSDEVAAATYKSFTIPDTKNIIVNDTIF